MQWNISNNDEPLPPKYLRAHFSKLRQSRTKRQNQHQIQISQLRLSQTKGHRIVTQIDNQLEVTYKQLKQHKRKNSFLIQKPKQNISQFDIENNQQWTQQRKIFNNLKYNTVRQYVRYIYENYSLQDPLESQSYQTPTNKIKSNRKQISTKRQSNTTKKILSLKDNFREQLNSQPTVKKETKQFIERQSYCSKGQQQISQFYLKNSYTRASNILNNSLNYYQQSINLSKGPIKQQFRYCFMCGQAMLTANIKYHEKTCEQLRNAYKMSTFQLIESINNKIKQIKTQIDQSFLNKNSFQLTQMVQKIQYQMRNAIKIHNQELNADQVKLYEKISEQIQKSKILKVFQLMSRLKWFSHIKINLQRKSKFEKKN